MFPTGRALPAVRCLGSSFYAFCCLIPRASHLTSHTLSHVSRKYSKNIQAVNFFFYTSGWVVRMGVVEILLHTCYLHLRQKPVGDPSCCVQGERRGDPNRRWFGCKPLLKTALRAVFLIQRTRIP